MYKVAFIDSLHAVHHSCCLTYMYFDQDTWSGYHTRSVCIPPYSGQNIQDQDTTPHLVRILCHILWLDSSVHVYSQSAAFCKLQSLLISCKFPYAGPWPRIARHSTNRHRYRVGMRMENVALPCSKPRIMCATCTHTSALFPHLPPRNLSWQKNGIPGHNTKHRVHSQAIHCQ